jgi:S1-C subfamily serine protease
MNFSENLVAAVEKVKPAVVALSTTRVAVDYMLHPVPVAGVGSGFVVREDGYIVTSAHVVEGAEKLQVIFSDGKTVGGHVVGADARTDVALVKVDLSGLHVAKMGNSDKIKVGQIVLALGNPLWMVGDPTVTLGVVSAISRTIRSERMLIEDLIQTDAAINPGNSGGPLINIEGEVIGINTAIVPFAQGIGFAIPVNTAKRVVNDLIKYGTVIRPWLGVYSVGVTENVARYYDLPVKEGCLVVEVVEGSPADDAGIRAGDVIIRIDGEKISDPRMLRKTIEEKNVGQAIDIVVARGSFTKTIRLKLGETRA